MLFPGYLDQLGGAGFVTKSLESALHKRSDFFRAIARRFLGVS